MAREKGYAPTRGPKVIVPEEIPTKNKVGGQRRMLKDKKSEVSWW